MPKTGTCTDLRAPAKGGKKIGPPLSHASTPQRRWGYRIRGDGWYRISGGPPCSRPRHHRHQKRSSILPATSSSSSEEVLQAAAASSSSSEEVLHAAGHVIIVICLEGVTLSVARVLGQHLAGSTTADVQYLLQLLVVEEEVKSPERALLLPCITRPIPTLDSPPGTASLPKSNDCQSGVP